MIGRRQRGAVDEPTAPTKGFDDFELRLGDTMRGERATMGKSLLDVQRELRIKANYIAAIENCDPGAFDTPGFIAGYVRSYARYLGMDPDECFARFCAESGFSVAHGMSERASTIRKPSPEAPLSGTGTRDPLANPRLPFAAAEDRFLSGVEPGAVGSILVLLALIGGIGYGGWALLQEVQRVQVAPVDQTPLVLSELDPLDQAMSPSVNAVGADDGAGVFTPPSQNWYDRVQRPEALDTPVLIARDGPISTLDPDRTGVFARNAAPGLPQIDESVMPASEIARQIAEQQRPALPFSDAPAAPRAAVAVVAARPAWVRLRDEGGAVLFSGILNAGDSLDVPLSAVAPRIEVGESGAVYFALGGQVYGPAGANGAVTSDIPLEAEALLARYEPATVEDDRDLAPIVAQLGRPGAPGPAAGQGPTLRAEAPALAAPGQPPASDAPFDPVAAAIAAATQAETPQGGATANRAPMPQVLADMPAGVTVVATREVWVRVRAASGATIYEAIMQPGDSYRVPSNEVPPTIRAGDAGAIYFAVNGKTYGPYGANGAVADNLALSQRTISADLAEADLTANSQLARIVAELSTR